MIGYRCFMRNVSLKFITLLLVCCFACQGYADECPGIRVVTEAEVAANKIGKGIIDIFKLEKPSFDDKMLKRIRVYAIKDQGVGGYFNPKIKVCDYEGNNCYELYNNTRCRKIYGTQSIGAGVSAAVFVDWDGDFVSIKREGGPPNVSITSGWEWAEGITPEEKLPKDTPKICVCMQKAACKSGLGADFTDMLNSNYNNQESVCDNCYGQKIQCAPVPLAPTPPPFCYQLKSSPPQVRIVPVSNRNNDYFSPEVRVIIGDLNEGKNLSVDHKQYTSHEVKDNRNITHYFRTYKEKNTRKLCASYYGTQKGEKNPQFTRCFPSPPAPEPEIDRIKNSNTLRIKMKMSSETCKKVSGAYRGKIKDEKERKVLGECAFDIYNNRYIKDIGPFSLKVVKPAMKKNESKTEKNDSSQRDKALDEIIARNETFEMLRKLGGCVPKIEVKCTKPGGHNECTLDGAGYPNQEVIYEQDNSHNMLCISGYNPEPEEFVIEREGKIIALKSTVMNYAKYVSVYSEESKQMDYSPLNETYDLLALDQNKLDKIIFDRQEYVSISEDENNKERELCIVKEDKDIQKKRESNKCRIVYKLTDSGHVEEDCTKGQGSCGRSIRFVSKENGKPFYLKYKEEDCKDKENKTHRCQVLQEKPIRANKTEVFYADKLCRFDLGSLANDIGKIINQNMKDKFDADRRSKENGAIRDVTAESSGGYYDLSKYESVEIEVWGGGEAGHIQGRALATQTRIGIPGDYIKAKLKVDKAYPHMKIKVTEGGGNRELYAKDKNGGLTIVEICQDQYGRKCKVLIAVAGGGENKGYIYNQKNYEITEFYRDLGSDETLVMKIANLESTENRDKQVEYIENGTIRYKNVECNQNYKMRLYGAGGCIDKEKGTYGGGSPGYAIIRPKLARETDEERRDREKRENKIIDAINKSLTKSVSDVNKENNGINIKELETLLQDSTIRAFDPYIARRVENEIKKRLSCN